MGKINPAATVMNTVLRTASGGTMKGNVIITASITTRRRALIFSRMNEPWANERIEAPIQ